MNFIAGDIPKIEIISAAAAKNKAFLTAEKNFVVPLKSMNEPRRRIFEMAAISFKKFPVAATDLFDAKNLSTSLMFSASNHECVIRVAFT